MEVTLDGEKLSAAESKHLLAPSEGLAFIRGEWVEVDRQRLSRTLEQFEAIERRAVTDGLWLGEAMRMLAGAGIAGDEAAGQADVAWAETVAGPGSRERWRRCVIPRDSRVSTLADSSGHFPALSAGGRRMALSARTAKAWGILADDMGLGKTIQVLSLLLVLKPEARNNRKPCLLVAPASLLANWAAEIARFAPSLKAVVAHPSAAPAESLKSEGPDNLPEVDFVITSYGYLARSPWLGATPWRLVVLDEARPSKILRTSRPGWLSSFGPKLASL